MLIKSKCLGTIIVWQDGLENKEISKEAVTAMQERRAQNLDEEVTEGRNRYGRWNTLT